MKTVILGGGALGSIIGAHLHRAGGDVLVVAREPRASLLAKQGVRIAGLQDFVARVPIVRDVSEAADGELYINALKTFQSPPVLKAFKPRAGAVALSVQNGVYKNKELAQAFGPRGVLGASAMISGEVLTDGAVRFTVNDSLQVGEPAGGESERSRAVVKLLADAGISTSLSTSIASVEWSKYGIFVPSFCLAVISRQETCRFLQHEASARVFAELARGMAWLAAAEGVPLLDGGGIAASVLARVEFDESVRLVQAFGAKLAANAPQHKVSGLQDLEKGRRTEVEEIVGYAWRLAQQHGVDLPALRTCYQLASSISDGVR